MVVDDSILRADKYAGAYRDADPTTLADTTVIAYWSDNRDILNVGGVEDLSRWNVDVWEETEHS